MLMKSMNDNAKALRERLTSPIGGDLLILAMSLDQAFPAKAPAQPPSAVPPPLERTAETEFLFQDIGAEGEPLLKLKNQPTAPPAGGSSPMEIKNLSEDDSSTAESSGFDIDDYV